MDGTLDGSGKIAGDATNGLDVDVTRMPATAADGGSLPSTTVAVSGYDGTNVQVVKTDVNGLLQVGDGAGSLTVDASASTFGVNCAQVSGTAIDTNSGSKSAGTQRVVLATDQPQLTNALKVDGSAVTQPVSGTVTVNEATATTGGATPSVTISAASTNATSVKASAGTLYGVMLHNINAAVRYFKVYNKASAPTVGTDTPVLVFPIPGNTAGAGVVLTFSAGVALGTGIAFALTTGVANSDTGAVAANEIVVNLLYK